MDIGGIDLVTIKSWFDATGGLKSINDALDIGAKIKGLFGKGKGSEAANASSAEIRELMVEMRERLLTAREEASALRERAFSIEKKLRRVEDFESKRESYKLVEIAPRSFSYQFTKTGQANEPRPCVCQHCFDHEKRISILQFVKQEFYRDTLKCHACGAEVFQANDIRMEVHTTGPRREFDLW